MSAYDEDRETESFVYCVRCNQECGPAHWSRIVARTVLCHDCEREIGRKPAAAPPVHVPNRREINH